MITPEEILIIKKSWKVFRSIDPAIIGDTFYSKLFSDHPKLRHMFPKDMKGQYVKIIDTLNVIVARLDKLDELSADIAAMARRHVGYGVKTEHYKMVGTALLWTLKQGLGSDWTVSVENAWKKCYQLLADTMISASSKQEID